MDRREVMGTGLLAIAGLATTGAVMAEATSHAHHGVRHKALADAAGTCVGTGQACLDHCLHLLARGDKELGACAKSVNQMLSLCSALQDLTNQDSNYLVKLAAVAAEACQDCENECKKHADKHEACKRCGESCHACYKECKQLAT